MKSGYTDFGARGEHRYAYRAESSCAVLLSPPQLHSSLLGVLIPLMPGAAYAAKGNICIVMGKAYTKSLSVESV